MQARRTSGQGNQMNASIAGYSSASISEYSLIIPANAADTMGKRAGLVLREFCKIGDFFVRARRIL